MRIGIIGAGQLGQMLGFAATELGDSCEFVDPAAAPPAAAAGHVIRAAFDDPAALDRLAAASDVITFEFENVPVAALQGISARMPVYPPPEALRQAQDRLFEKRLFESLDIPLPAWHAVDSRDSLDEALRHIGTPLVLKTRRLGYDGKGQFVLRDTGDADAAWQALGGQALIAEQWVPFDCEVSVIGARNPQGDVVTYPLTQNEHADGILRLSRAPYEDDRLFPLAEGYMRRLLDRLDYVGVLALELFVVGDTLLANEFAPRVHNSGHWTIEGARTSQFENHLRAVTGRQLGSTAMRGHAGMLNLIGTLPDAARRLACGVLHDYGKSPRPGRKLGHITVVAGTAMERDRLLARVDAQICRPDDKPEPTA
jgi:5-(carboxyamino)imidazole ribonucleotide synthase